MGAPSDGGIPAGSDRGRGRGHAVGGTSGRSGTGEGGRAGRRDSRRSGKFSWALQINTLFAVKLRTREVMTPELMTTR